MRQLLLLIVVAIIAVSCGVRRSPVTLDDLTREEPSVGERSVANLGDALYTQQSGSELKMIEVTNTAIIKPNNLLRTVKPGHRFKLLYQTPEYWLYESTDDFTYGVALPKDGSELWAYGYKMASNGIHIFPPKEPMEYREYSEPSPNNFVRREFIYNGRVGSSVRFIYREFVNDIARPAFTQELQYDLSVDDTVGFKALRIRVYNATNRTIDYVVEQGF